MRAPVANGRPVVVKVGSSSLVRDNGELDQGAVARVADQLTTQWDEGRPCVLVTSAAVAAGVAVLNLDRRPTDTATLQMTAAVGQTKLMSDYAAAFAQRGRTVAQVLLTKDVLWRREQYINAREAMTRMIGSGVVPIVNENDTVAVDELRFGDNDRLAAIASHLVSAGMLVLLTDTDGLFAEDPRVTPDAPLLDAVRLTDEVLSNLVSEPGRFGSGGVATKIAAAQMASWSGVPTVVAPASDPLAVSKAVSGAQIGTWIEARPQSLPSRKLWIAFGAPVAGTVVIDEGASSALVSAGRSLLPAGVVGVDGEFSAGAAVEVRHAEELVAKGLVKMGSSELKAVLGAHSSVAGGEVIHRDDLVVVS